MRTGRIRPNLQLPEPVVIHFTLKYRYRDYDVKRTTTGPGTLATVIYIVNRLLIVMSSL